MTDDQPQPASVPDGVEDDLPQTDDPTVLRELLRQAREQLRLRESFERMLADNTARTETLLRESRASATIDPASLAREVADVRQALEAALAATDRLDAIVAAVPVVSTDAPGTTAVTDESPTRTVEVLVHEVNSPALARSLQQHLAGLAGVERAEVRELAEGMLRISVTGTASIDDETLAGWEPSRDRTARTAGPGVLEIVLAPTAS